MARTLQALWWTGAFRSPAMTNEPDPLTLPANRGARLVALDRLEAADGPADRLVSKPDDLDALHDFRVALRRVRSWLRAFRPELEDSISGKDRHRLRDLVDATNLGRDADVQIEWLEKASRNGNGTGNRKRSAERLIDQIRIERRRGAASLDGDKLEAYVKERSRLSKRLSTVKEPVRPPSTPPPTLAATISSRLSSHLDAFDQALRAVRSAEDEAEAHAARIAAKRLRYLLEPASHVRGCKSLITQLKRLQDELGELHDAHILGHRLRGAVTDFEGPDQAGVRIINERLGADRAAIFHRIERRWLSDDAAIAEFRHRAGLLAERLNRISEEACADLRPGQRR